MPDDEPTGTKYNLLGHFILRERGDLQIKQIAQRGGIDYLKLRRVMRNASLSVPDPEMLQGIADGLGCSLARVQRVALEASRHVDLSRLLQDGGDDDERLIISAVRSVTLDQKHVLAQMVELLASQFERANEAGVTHASPSA